MKGTFKQHIECMLPFSSYSILFGGGLLDDSLDISSSLWHPSDLNFAQIEQPWHFQDKAFKCQECNQSFDTQHALDLHVKCPVF